LVVPEKLKGKLKPDFNSISEPQKGSYIIPSGFINKFVKDFDLKTNLDIIPFDRSSIYLSSKAGPHGPSTVNALNSLTAYSTEDIENLKKLTDTVGAKYLEEVYAYANKGY
jgi:hypothetical protein